MPFIIHPCGSLNTHPCDTHLPLTAHPYGSLLALTTHPCHMGHGECSSTHHLIKAQIKICNAHTCNFAPGTCGTALAQSHQALLLKLACSTAPGTCLQHCSWNLRHCSCAVTSSTTSTDTQGDLKLG
eukprot:scaffold139560_cov21-Tisochrysis_lutea.AAC.1